MKKLFWSLLISLTTTASLYATPSSQIWNPSTDIQTVKTWHLGIDNYFSVTDNKTKPVNVPTDVNLTYGPITNLEVGFDYFGANYFGAPDDPLQFNAKYALPEGDKRPAIAVGGQNFGTKPDFTDFNIVYALIAKTFKPVGRFTVGYYAGNNKLLLDEKGAGREHGHDCYLRQADKRQVVGINRLCLGTELLRSSIVRFLVRLFAEHQRPFRLRSPEQPERCRRLRQPHGHHTTGHKLLVQIL